MLHRGITSMLVYISPDAQKEQSLNLRRSNFL
jgi:hypothetical protein